MSTRRIIVFSTLLALLLIPILSVMAGGAGDQAPAKSGEQVTLQYVFWGDQNEVNATKAFADSYMTKNPNIKITLLHIPQSNTYMDKINTLAASHNLPDLGYFQETNVLQWGMNGQFVDLTDFYKNQPEKLDVLKFVTPDKKIVGVSVANEIQVIWYNKKMFDAAGLPYPPSDPSQAWSWDKFVEVAKKLTKDVNGKSPNDAGFDPANIKTFGTWIQQWYMPWVTFAIANGGGMVSQDGKQLLMDNPGTIDAIQKMADLINVHHVSPTPGTQQMPTAAATALLSQQVAMVIDGTWDLLTIGITKEQSGLDFGVGVLPKMKSLATTSVGTPIVIFKSSKHVKEAEDFLKYIMDPTNALPLMQSGLWLPNELQWYKDPTFISKWVDNTRHPAEYKSAVVDFARDYAKQLPVYYIPQFQKMDDVIEPALNQVWLGQKTAKDVIVNEIMPKIKPIFEGK